MQPNHKIDHTFVRTGSSSSLEKENVSWIDIIFPWEEKGTFSTERYKEVRLQNIDNLLEIFNKQPERKFGYGAVGCGLKFELYRLENSKGSEVHRSGVLDFLLPGDHPTQGFKLYLQLLSSDLPTLGFQINDIPFPGNIRWAGVSLKPGIAAERGRSDRCGPG